MGLNIDSFNKSSKFAVTKEEDSDRVHSSARNRKGENYLKPIKLEKSKVPEEEDSDSDTVHSSARNRKGENEEDSKKMIKKCVRKEFLTEKLGLNIDSFNKSSKFAVTKEEDSDTVHFLVSNRKGENYLKTIQLKKSKFEKDEAISIINKYTYHDTWYCTKINLLLASDSSDLEKEIEYVKKLDLSIKYFANKNPVKIPKCFRGMEMSLKEYESFKLNEFSFIPSFLSTRQSQNKFYSASNHNALIEIKLDYVPNNAIYVTEELSKYASEEEEVLFSCYSRFKVIKKEQNKLFNNKLFSYYLRLEHVNCALERSFDGIIAMISLSSLY